jgi:hypothetical protein
MMKREKPMKTAAKLVYRAFAASAIVPIGHFITAAIALGIVLSVSDALAQLPLPDSRWQCGRFSNTGPPPNFTTVVSDTFAESGELCAPSGCDIIAGTISHREDMQIVFSFNGPVFDTNGNPTGIREVVRPSAYARAFADRRRFLLMTAKGTSIHVESHIWPLTGNAKIAQLDHFT